MIEVLELGPSPNRSIGRAGHSIRYIVVHTTEGTDSRSWLLDPAARVSAHYLVREDLVYRLVSESDTAWHAGRIVGEPTTPHYTGKWEDIYENGILIGGGWTVNPNRESIGIEAEGYAARVLTPRAIATLAELVREVRGRHGALPLVPHSALSPGDRSDPGAENFARLQAVLEEDDMITREQYAREIEPLVKATLLELLERDQATQEKVAAVATRAIAEDLAS